jgi:hypothetical protein
MDMSRGLSQAVLKELECPVCMEYMVPPIKLCTIGHNICSKCRERVQYCPMCRAEFSETRNVALENIARIQKYPCANRQSGCLELFSIEHINEHQADCVYGEIKCPFKFNCSCTWNGLKSDLKEHAKVAHKAYFFESPSIHSSLFEGTFVKLLSCFGELFVEYEGVRDGKLYCAVQLIGTSSEASKYKCVFTLRAANGIEQIWKTSFVSSYREDFETIFNSGKCFCLDEAVVRSFLEGKSAPNMTVTLSREH